MSFDNHFYSSQSTFMTPLSIIPNGGNNSSSAWSPFSAPSFSPYDVNETLFQYSNMNVYSNSFIPANSLPRPISKNKNNNQKDVLRELDNNMNQTNYSVPSSSLSQFLKNLATINSSENQSTSQYQSFQNQYLHHNAQIKKDTNLCSFANSDDRSKILPKRSDQVDMSEYIKLAAIQRATGGRTKMCTFCKTNGESPEIYTSHSLKDSTDKITCPILMKYACPVCGATGEQTHTKKYCPVLQKKIRFDMLKKISTGSSSSSSSSSASSSPKSFFNF